MEKGDLFEILNILSLTRQQGVIKWKSKAKIFTAFKISYPINCSKHLDLP